MDVCRIKQDALGWYYHVSRLGYPGLESELFSTKLAAAEAAARDYPDVKVIE
jgi:hypothetical protein